ncbi:MAG: hypothetical protein WDN28_13215 [Chthoniobacter sp.]
MTNVNGGKLIVSGSLNGTAGVNVNSGGMLSGSGLITTGANGNVILGLGGRLAPSAESTLSFALGTGSLDLTAGVTPDNTASLLFALDPRSGRVRRSQSTAAR